MNPDIIYISTGVANLLMGICLGIMIEKVRESKRELKTAQAETEKLIKKSS